jgi:DNA-binding beta-propeller fold protein YncE
VQRASAGIGDGLVAVTPDGRTAVVTAVDGVSLVDVQHRKVKTRIKMGGVPFGVAVAPDGATAYVTTEFGGAVESVDVGRGVQPDGLSGTARTASWGFRDWAVLGGTTRWNDLYFAVPGRRRIGVGPRCMLICMQSTSVRIDVSTHEELKRLAAELNTTVGNTVSLAVRALRQDRMGKELSAPLRKDEAAWLDADLG